MYFLIYNECMNNKELQSSKPLKSWISLTGYRILLILKSLIESGRTLDELIDIVRNDKITGKSFSRDTIRVAINTLKAAGCEISRPSKSNNYKYELIKHPFGLNLADDELSILIRLRERFTETMNWNDIFVVNNLYKKIVTLTCDENKIKTTIDSQPLGQLNRKMLKEITNPDIIGKLLKIQYKSPKFGMEDINIIPRAVKIENSKLYLWCYNLKYNKNSLLPVDRITEIKSRCTVTNQYPQTTVYDVIYELTNIDLQNFNLKDNEEIITRDEDKMIIKANVDNEFLFIQRLLLLGSNFKIISPDFFREKLIDKIKLIQKGYEQ